MLTLSHNQDNVHNMKKIGYETDWGRCLCGDSLNLLTTLKDKSINLIFTSPPFALQRKKEYGNEIQSNYVNWMCDFAKIVYDKLRDDGSFVIDIGGAYKRGLPEYSLYQFKLLIFLCDELGFKLAQPFYWHNSSALPSPIEWVNKRKLRAKTSVDTIWWLCKDPYCKADVKKILVPYSDRMKKLIKKPDDFVKEEGIVRPSGHSMGKASWGKDNGGAIPSNMIQIPNSDSNSSYIRYCKLCNIKAHPARFPKALPEFFIKFLTDKNDLVVDIFSGSNTTGEVAESLQRKWISFEIRQDYVASSSLRFANNNNDAQNYYNTILNGKYIYIKKSPKQLCLDL